MNYKHYAIAMIAGSVVLEYICFKNLYVMQYPGLTTVLILPIIFFFTGIGLLILGKRQNKDNQKDE